jgi:SAM-dependent methyltransferase
MTKSLDLGSGSNPQNWFGADEVFGIDIREGMADNVKCADLAIEPIPHENEEFDFVTAFDFIEHIPRVVYLPHRRNSFIELMNEIHRVLKPEGRFFSYTPAYPKSEAFRDPTHVNIITNETFTLYFDNVFRLASIYGFTGSFEVLQQHWQGAHLFTLLKKV